jgi:hypothetical protein
MALSTTGDFIKPPGTESILKFGKVNPVITAKKLANQKRSENYLETY